MILSWILKYFSFSLNIFFYLSNWCFHRYRWYPFSKQTTLNPFPHTDAFWRLCSRRLLKTMWLKKKLLKQAISPFAAMFSTFFSNYTFIYGDLCFFPRCFQSCRLQICLMWERVKNISPNKQSIKWFVFLYNFPFYIINVSSLNSTIVHSIRDIFQSPPPKMFIESFQQILSMWKSVKVTATYSFYVGKGKNFPYLFYYN